MSNTPETLVAEALGEWITVGLRAHNDFAREGLPAMDVGRFLDLVSAPGALLEADLSFALVGFGTSAGELAAQAAARGLRAVTDDLHVATEWRNNRGTHPRIVALARGYNPSVHGLGFFATASSSELARHLIHWAERQDRFSAAPAHKSLLRELADAPSLGGLRSLDTVARFLSAWSAAPDGIDAPRSTLPALGLLSDPRLFEASDLGARLARNVAAREVVTVLAPSEIRRRRQRAAKYTSRERREAMETALKRLDRFRSGNTRADLTLEDAELLVRPPKDVAVDPVATSEGDESEEPTERDPRATGGQALREDELDALLSGREDDLVAIGEAMDRGWEEFGGNGDTVVATAETSAGPVAIEVEVETRTLEWAAAFCSAERFGGLIETEVLDLKQALERYSEGEPLFLEPSDVWRHDGRTFSLDALLEGWDRAVVPDSGRPLVIVWAEFRERRAGLAAYIRQLLVHPREYLDTHPAVRRLCEEYLALATELYSGVQTRFQVVSDMSAGWAQATLDALLSFDLLQVRIRHDADVVSAKAVMLPLHPLHLWRHHRIGALLRSFAQDRTLAPDDRSALLAELRRPEQFLSVVRAGAAPAGRGLDQVLPVANFVYGLATFENLRNAISSPDGVETLVRALDHFVLLYPNHARPLRLALVNPPEPTKLIERVVKLLDERRHASGGIGRIEVDVFATDDHRDRLAAALVLEGGAQDLVYEKVAAERLELRVAQATTGGLAALVDEGMGGRRYHVTGLFDESTIAVRKHGVDGLLGMSPFCVRQEITVDGLLGGIALRPHPGEPPFSDFVLMIQARQGERLDTAMYAAADADRLRATIDALVMGADPRTRWVMLADRALPREAGMRSVRLLEGDDGKRKVLLAAGDYDRLADVMESAFRHCNLPVGRRELGEVLRQGANLVGGGLLDLIRKQSGEADNSAVVGFVGMLIAARDARRRDVDCLVASVDTPIARLWLRLGVVRTGTRCDLLSLRRTEDGAFVFTLYEIKTTLDPALPEEDQRVSAGVAQVVSTAEVMRGALADTDIFSPPRLEMLKQVLVRAAGIRWSNEDEDAGRRRRWGPWLKELFDDDADPVVRVEGEVVLVKLRANEEPRRTALAVDGLAVWLSTITEPLARRLLGVDPEPRAAAPVLGQTQTGGSPTRSALGRAYPKGQADRLTANVASHVASLNRPMPSTVVETAGSGAPTFPPRPVTDEQAPLVDFLSAFPSVGMGAVHLSAAGSEAATEGVATPTLVPATVSAPNGPPTTRVLPAPADAAPGSWPPPLNALGMVGQYEAARELADLASKARGWNERFPDKLLVGPAGVGKTSIAHEVSTRFLRLTPVLFNGADLRRPEMIVERLVKLELVPEAGTAETVRINPCVVFVDEVHAIAPSVATTLLSALDERRTTTVDNVVYDFGHVVFLLATTDPGKLTEAFLSRPTRTTLRPYTLEETAGIVWLRARGMLDGADLSRATCLEIAARMQCSPRPSVQVLNQLVANFYALAERESGGAVPTRADVARRMDVDDVGRWFSDTMKVDANGIGPLHREMLVVLSRRGAVSEDELRRSLGISNRGDFVEIAEYVTRLGLIKVGTGGRSLSGDGRRYVLEGDRMDLRDRIPKRAGG